MMPKKLIGIALVALTLRMAVVWLGSQEFRQDIDSYARLATNWSQTGTFGFLVDDEVEEAENPGVRPTAYRPPLYPWCLSWLVVDKRLNLAWVAILHVALGVATVLLTFQAAISLGVRHAWLPALAVACDPLLLRASQQVMTETLATFLAVLAWYLWVHASIRSLGTSKVQTAVRYLGLGLVLGLAILTRPTAVAWTMILLLAGWGVARRRGGANASSSLPDALPSSPPFGIQECLVTTAACAIVLSPWILRNVALFGQPIWATTHGGYTLLLANNPRIYDHFRAEGFSRGWDAEPFHRAWAQRMPPSTNSSEELTPTEEAFWYSEASEARNEPLPEGPRQFVPELADNQIAYSAARATMGQHPVTFLKSCFIRCSWFWAAWPYAETPSKSTFAIGGWYLTWFAAAAFGCFHLFKGARSVWGWLPILSMIVALTLVHSIYWGNMRMRGQLMPGLYCMAALAFDPSARKKAGERSRD